MDHHFPIKRESDAVLELGDDLADYLDKRATTSPDALEDEGKFEQVGAYLLSTFMRLGTITLSSLAARHDPASIARLDQSLAALASRIEISAEICARHPGVSPVGLQQLLQAFRAYGGDVENLLPAPVDSKDSYDRFVTIMRRINRHVYPAFDPDQLVPLYGVVIVEWLRGYTLATMIKRNIEWHRNNGRAFRLPLLIRNTMELVERIARFAAPKYFSAYVDILNLHLPQIGRLDLTEDDLDIGIQLEFGVSSRTLLSLIELGLSRMSAATLYEAIARDDLTKEDCVVWVAERNAQFEGMGIPAIIVSEIRRNFCRLRPNERRQSERCVVPAKPITIGSVTFAKKGDADHYLLDMLYRYDLGDKVSADDGSFLLETLKRHPEASEKIGGGITHFSVRAADFGTRCFWLNRSDGSTEKFSFRTCIYR